jgi:hypothetical protein
MGIGRRRIAVCILCPPPSLAASLDGRSAEPWAIPALTRRRDLEAQDECWHVYYGDVRAGTIVKRFGIPLEEDPFGWACAFYPGCHPREQTHGTAATFDKARVAFEEAWRVFLSNRTEADFREWREAQAFTAWKYRMWDTGHRLPTQSTNGRSTCFCGAGLIIGSVPDHVRSAHLETA